MMLLLSCAYFVLVVIFGWIHVAKHSSHSHLEQANHVFNKMSHSLLQVQVNFTQTLMLLRKKKSTLRSVSSTFFSNHIDALEHG